MSEPSTATRPGARRPTRFNRLKRWLLLLTVPYVGTAIMLASVQRSLIYAPYPEKNLPAATLGMTPGQAHDVVTRTEDDLELHGWLILASGHRAKADDELKAELAQGRFLVIYFCGNAGNRSYRQLEIELLTQVGADVLIFDFRGYGDSPGEPTEEGLARDARAAWQFATESLNVEPRRVVLFGESLGGGVAVRLAHELSVAKTPPGGLIVRSTFSSLTDVGAHHFPWLPVRWLLLDRFPSEQRIPEVTCSLLQFHGLRDTIIPLRFGRKLFAAVPDKSATGVAKTFVELPNADHNDVLETSSAEISRTIRRFFDALDTADSSSKPAGDAKPS